MAKKGGIIQEYMGATFVAVMFIVSFILLSPNITGNVVSTGAQEAKNIFGVILFIGSLIGAFFIFKRHLWIRSFSQE